MYQPCSIREVKIDPPLVLAPMAGVTDLAFRLLCKGFGAGLVCTEFVSAYGLTYGNPKTRSFLLLQEAEHPVSVQIFGAEPERMATAAKMVEDAGADLVDLNLGCTAPQIGKMGAGARLLQHPRRVAAIVEAMVRTVSIPVTVKTRLGWSEENLNVVAIARLCEGAGAAAIAVHGRTAQQRFRGRANWEAIGEVKAAVSIPVIGNGDVRTPEDARRMFQQTGCQAVMIGRGARGNPWLFSRTAHYLRTGELLPPPTPQERLALALRHGRMLKELKGEQVGLREMRKHLSWYFRGLPHAARWRERVHRARTWEELVETIENYGQLLAAGTLRPSRERRN